MVQLALQITAFRINANAASFLNEIIVRGNGTVDGFTVLGKDLRLCTEVPQRALDTSNCAVIWDGAPMDQTVPMNLSNLAGSGYSVVTSPPGQVDVPDQETSTAPSPSTSYYEQLDGITSVIASTITLSSSESSIISTVPTSVQPSASTHEMHTVTVTVVESLTPSQTAQIGTLKITDVKVSHFWVCVNRCTHPI